MRHLGTGQTKASIKKMDRAIHNKGWIRSAWKSAASSMALRGIFLRRVKYGVDRFIELGDGQVSDIVGWSPERFLRIWNAYR
jgi:hypothetical protein